MTHSKPPRPALSTPAALARPPSRQTRIYLEAWRAILRQGGEATLTFATYPDALAARTAMFGAIRPYRHGQLIDAELAEAADKITLIIPDKGHVVVATAKQRERLADALLTQLGLSEEGAATVEEINSARRMAEAVDQTSNPFFKR